MTINNIQPSQNERKYYLNTEEIINLEDIYKFLKRNFRRISYISFSFFLIGIVYTFTRPKIYEGQFQIVVNPEKKDSPSVLSSDAFTTLSNLSRRRELNTEVQILKSPSLLMSIFEYVKKEKKDLYTSKELQQWRFTDWLEDFFIIQLEKDTNVLNLIYRDSDKDIILPVLNQISNKYLFTTKARSTSICHIVSSYF